MKLSDSDLFYAANKSVQFTVAIITNKITASIFPMFALSFELSSISTIMSTDSVDSLRSEDFLNIGLSVLPEQF